MEEMSPETVRALGGRKGLASLDEAKVGLVAEQAKLHAQDKFRQGAVQAAASATGLDADTVGWLGSSVGALDYACDCGWTEDYACPSAEQPGRKGWAQDASTQCYKYCCEGAGSQLKSLEEIRDVATLRGDEADEEYEVEGIARNLLGQRCASSSVSAPSFAPAIDAAGGCLYANHGGRSCTVTSASHRRFCPCVVY